MTKNQIKLLYFILNILLKTKKNDPLLLNITSWILIFKVLLVLLFSKFLITTAAKELNTSKPCEFDKGMRELNKYKNVYSVAMAML